MGGVELLPKEYGYVVLALVSYCFLNFWMAFQVESENKDAKLLNCVQGIRIHWNSCQYSSSYWFKEVFNIPIISASFGLVYAVGRYFYFTGYAAGVPRNRGLVFFGNDGLGVCTISFGISLLTYGVIINLLSA
ncbi:hypothetical protein MKW98_030826 [Papaver atlanticum]|uniref:Uncharacterized protein n=1 Tax=Papaver atlanticum TaxID=357466 RepID=A0AAD4S0E8_9MAGN|nr:hypothetical protein MKW98_030826 [Papaver atlanticum]